MELPKNTRIILHIVLWSGLWIIPGLGHADFIKALVKSLPGILTFLTIFYVNYFVIVPIFIIKTKCQAPILRLVMINMVFFSLIHGLHHLLHLHLVPPPSEFYHSVNGSDFHSSDSPINSNHDELNPKVGHHRPLFFDFILMGLCAALAAMLRLYDKLQSDRTHRQELETEYLQSELSYLKLQLSPHFLFNTLNNIYCQIELKPSDAQNSILNLSQMLRYMLYETDKELVELKREIHFLQSYIDLMSLRTSQCHVDFQYPSQLDHKLVPPLLFLPLIENAFKHGTHALQASTLHIELTEELNSWRLLVRNPNFPKAKDQSGSGLGLSNLQKRLQVIYGGHAFYEALLDQEIYTATLRIPKEEK